MRADLHLSTIVVILYLWMPAVNSVPYQTYVSHDNINCIPCPPGQKVAEDCKSEASESKCEPCEAGFFMPNASQFKYCNKCHQSACPKDAFVLQNCTATTNHICKCQNGYHRYPLDELDDWLNCRKHTPCEEGKGVVHPGSHLKDRECRLCRTKIGQDQEFVNNTDPENPVCQNCSTCPESWIEEKSCSVNMDTICSSNGTVQNRTTTTTITESTEKDKSKPGNKELDSGAIAGIAMAVVVFFLLLILVVTIVCIKRRKKSRRCGNVQNTELKRFLDRDCQLQPKESENVTINHQAAADSDVTSQNGGITEIEWNREVITKDGFNFLSQNLGAHWEMFIRFLPGFVGDEASVVIYMCKSNNQFNTVNQIYDALNEWSQRYPNFVTKENICNVLNEIDLNSTLNDMKKVLREKNMHNNVQMSGALREPVLETGHNHQ